MGFSVCAKSKSGLCTKTALFFASPWIPFVVLIAAVLVSYANVYGNVFLYDDEVLIIKNQFLRTWQSLPSLFTTSIGAGSNSNGIYYRPLQMALYLGVFQAVGLQAWAFHLLNVLLHAANACLVFALGRKLKFDPRLAFFASLLWAVHPLHVEAVTYMSATADPLYALFCLWGANVLLPDLSPRRIGLASLIFILALMSKESAIAFPLLAGALVYYVSEKRLDYKTYLRLWPLAVVAVFYIAFRFGLAAQMSSRALDVNQAPSASSSVMDLLATFPVYLRLLLCPTPLYMKHLVSASGILGMAQSFLGLLLVGGSAVLVLRRQKPATLPLAWGLLWFFAAFFPVSFAGKVVYEHWMYLPMAGLFLGAAQAASPYVKKEAYLLGISAVALTSLFGILTLQQNKIWHDPVIFYNNVIQTGDPAPNAHINLGIYYRSKGDLATALDHYALAEKDIARSPDVFTSDARATLQGNIAEALLSQPDASGRKDEAIQRLEKAVEFDPEYYPALVKLAEIYQESGDVSRAKAYQDQANAIRRRLGTYSEKP